MSTPRQVSATFFAIVEPKFGWRFDSQQGQRVECVDSVRVVQILQNRPKSPKGVCVKLTLRFNEQAFMPLKPAAVIDIPDSMVTIGEVVEVEALDENDQAVVEHLAAMARSVQ